MKNLFRRAHDADFRRNYIVYPALGAAAGLGLFFTNIAMGTMSHFACYPQGVLVVTDNCPPVPKAPVP
jgi:hypothetical protein